MFKGNTKPILLIIVILFVLLWNGIPRAAEESAGFYIRAFLIEGNTLLDQMDIDQALSGFKGWNRTSEDVEEARKILEGLYHKKGYPTVLVNIPEQNITEGEVRLEVVETRTGRVKVTGNRYVTEKKVRRSLPCFTPGSVIYFPDVKQDLASVNSGANLKVTPVFWPRRELGAVDIELQVEDKLPLHGDVGVNNRSTHTTSDLRAAATIRYDDLWERDHSISLQYQTSPEDTDEVRTLFLSYVFSSPWNNRHVLALYMIDSDSDISVMNEFSVLGKGMILGARYVMPLPAVKEYQHNASLGLDYKDFDERIGFKDGRKDIQNPIAYLPLSLSYGATIPDTLGSTQLDASINMVIRGLITEQDEFKSRRYNARGNYIYLKTEVERTQQLYKGSGLYAKLDGQIVNRPLIDNEQYSAGGMDNVRGYKESEELGDQALHLTMEIRTPNLFQVFGWRERDEFTLYGFYDGALLRVMEKLNEGGDSLTKAEDDNIALHGTGLGFRGKIGGHLAFRFDWGIALKETDQTEEGHNECYFDVKFQF